MYDIRGNYLFLHIAVKNNVVGLYVKVLRNTL